MKSHNNHSFDISTFNTITYRIHRGKVVIFIEDEDNHLDISFPIKDGRLFVILGSIRAAVAEAMTDYLEQEAYKDEPLLLIS
ncbi:hypothetical protein [[Phormidium ambiguum] IAM M-71]|uniref:hypothetical protein n=1 Tax=[Phormidium ambiguum] IAM M-71 TaxID=454136 RepID=UPI001F43C94D|nr:hypothetical protein [Phormidium ambiguum]